MKDCECKHNDVCSDNMAYPGNCKDFEELDSPKLPVDKIRVTLDIQRRHIYKLRAFIEDLD